MVNARILEKRILAARGDIPSDLVLKNGSILNVFSAEIEQSDVAIFDGVIVGVGHDYRGLEEKDLSGRYIIPGLIDGHLHIESTMLTPANLAKALLLHGTTTVVADPHEIANVGGIRSIYFMLEESALIPFDFFFMLPSCVPATHLETSGAILDAHDLAELKDHPRVLGLAEVMNFPAVLTGDHQIIEKLSLFKDQILNGHCPSLKGPDLQAYLTAGIRSDHETADADEALEKLQKGMMIMIREGSVARHLETLLPLINDKNSARFCIVSDDLNAIDIMEKGHLDDCLKKSISLGLDPVTAVQMVTRYPAAYFGLRDRGAIGPGYCADMVVVNDLEEFETIDVFKNGKLIVESGHLTDFPEQKKTSHEIYDSFHVKPLKTDDFLLLHGKGKARIIEMIPGQSITRQGLEHVASHEGTVKSDIESDILKLCVVERHRASGRLGLGLVRGFGIKHGAIASSVAHDSHNIIAVGVNDEEILSAIETVLSMRGGLAVVSGETVLARVPLEIGGLMTTDPMDILVPQLKTARDAAIQLGCLKENPFMALSFLALPVIPELKLTDQGLVNVNRFEIVPLFLGE